MRRRMMQHGRLASWCIDLRSYDVANRKPAFEQATEMPMRLPEFLRVIHGEAHTVRFEGAGITDLPTALGIERRRVEHDDACRIRIEHLDGLTFGKQRRHGGLTRQRVIASERRRRIDARQLRSVEHEVARSACALALLLHRGCEARMVDAQTPFSRNVGREILGKAVRVIELERRLTRDHTAVWQRFDGVLEDTHAV